MTFWKRMAYLLPWRRRAAERDMQEELQSIAAMAEPRELGNLTRAAEDARAEWEWAWLEHISQDVRCALRTLRKSPAFTATAVLSLALGIGAASSIFGLVNAVLLRKLPVPVPEELVLFAELAGEGRTLSWSLEQFRSLQQNDTFAGLCAFRPRVNFSVTRAGEAELSPGQLVSGNCYEVLGLRAHLGRLLTPRDDAVGEAHPVAVISHQFWRRHFDADPYVLGRTLELRGHVVSIVGVTPPDFYGFEPGRSVDITVPVSLQPWVFQHRLTSNTRWLRVIGRLRSNVSAERAASELAVRWRTVVGPARSGAPANRFVLLSGAQGLNDLREQFSLPLRLLMAAVGLLLLITCANLASLLLARARVREQELTLRLALGASRGRIVRQLLTESLMLSILGGAGGLALAASGSQAIVSLLSRGRAPILLDMSIDPRLLGFTLGITVATTLVFGLWPAFAATRRDLQSRLRATTRNVIGSNRRRAQALLTAQTVLSFVLVIAAGLFARSLTQLYTVDLGLDRHQAMVVTLSPEVAGETGGRAMQMLQDFSERLASVPGIRSFTQAMDLPFGGSSYRARIAPVGAPTDNLEVVSFNFVGPRFFETLGIPLIAGRDLQLSDDARSRPVAVISQSLASHYFPGRPAVGARLQFGAVVAEIVGVAKDVPYEGVRRERELVVYRPFSQGDTGVPGTYVIRTDLPPAALAETVRRALRELAPTVPVGTMTTLDAQYDGSIATERLLASIAGFFGVMALLLVAVGVYGNLASSVAQRTREFGIRLALGATGGRIVRIILANALLPVSLGIVIGLPLAFSSARIAQGALFGVTSHDPLTYLSSAVALLLVAVMAATIPSRKAARADAVSALRHV
jgi:putative ABC transport system permease protein